jgi:hypothetical protein
LYQKKLTVLECIEVFTVNLILHLIVHLIQQLVVQLLIFNYKVIIHLEVVEVQFHLIIQIHYLNLKIKKKRKFFNKTNY